MAAQGRQFRWTFLRECMKMAVCSISIHTSSVIPATALLRFAQNVNKINLRLNTMFIAFAQTVQSGTGHIAKNAGESALGSRNHGQYTKTSLYPGCKLAKYASLKSLYMIFMQTAALMMVAKSIEAVAKHAFWKSLKRQVLPNIKSKLRAGPQAQKTLFHRFSTTRQNENSTLGLTSTLCILLTYLKDKMGIALSRGLK
jgi:hypothetical protein